MDQFKLVHRTRVAFGDKIEAWASLPRVANFDKLHGDRGVPTVLETRTGKRLSIHDISMKRGFHTSAPFEAAHTIPIQ